jgi:hypothetical protein
MKIPICVICVNSRHGRLTQIIYLRQMLKHSCLLTQIAKRGYCVTPLGACDANNRCPKCECIASSKGDAFCSRRQDAIGERINDTRALADPTKRSDHHASTK